ncbi:MAG: hypothetical protein SNJ77_00895 [Cytophagales bacterium]
MQVINIGGVPEHFNIHWHIFFQNAKNSFPEFDFRWIDYSTGTGAMMKDLNEGKLDLAITLTEGTISMISEGFNAKILDFYVNSPLLWGIHTPCKSIIDINDIFNHKFGISRFGSGSHLMPKIHAKSLGKSLNDEQFVVVNNLNGALEAFSRGDCEVFYWEKFTTMPFVGENGFQCIGYFPSPWPCFVVSCNPDFAKNHNKLIKKIIEELQIQISSTSKSSLIEPIVEKYRLEKQHVQKWIEEVEWNVSNQNLELKISNTINQLIEYGILKTKPSIDDIIL